jgi:glycyl-tRNA synthetase
MDEAGTPFCITIDGDTLANGTATVRHRDSMAQDRIGVEAVADYVKERVSGAR